MNDSSKGRALGVGGIFFRSPDPARLGAWYTEHLGLQIENWGQTHGTSFSPADMPPSSFTVWSAFSADTEYFGKDDLDEAMENVLSGGAEILEEREEHDFGKFGWFVDPDGNRVELWEPPEEES